MNNSITSAVPSPIVQTRDLPDRKASALQEPTAQPAPAPVAPKGIPESAIPHYDPEVSRRQLQQAIEQLNEQVKKSSYNLNFSMDAATDSVVIRVRSASSGEILRQIPSDTVLHLAAHMKDLAELKGLLKDEKI